MKRATICILTFALMLTSFMGAYASEGSPAKEEARLQEDTAATDSAAKEEEIKEYTFSLSQAIEFAMTDNERLIANQYKQIGNDVSLDSAHLTRRSLKDVVVNVTSNFEMYCVREGYYVEATKMAQRLTIQEEEKIRSAIAYDVTNAYYNVVLAGKLRFASESAHRNALANSKIVDEQYKLGLIPALDYENAEISTLATKNALDSCIINEEMAIENFKTVVGIDDPDALIILTDEIECEEYTSDVDADIEKALTTRYDLTALKENMLLSERYMELAAVLTENSATYNTAYASFLEAQYNYNSTLKLIKLSMKSAYNKIVTSKESMDIAEKQYNIALRQYEAAKVKYDIGAISNMELTSSIDKLYDAQVSFAQAKLGYRMAIETYRYEITTGL